MNTVKGLNVNHIAGTIEATKKFLKAAGNPFSAECELLIATRAKFPEYILEEKEIEKNANKMSYEGLSIEKMLGFITAIKTAEEVKEFERYIEIYTDEKTRKIIKGKYATIKKLFLNRYREEYTNLTDEQKAIVDEKAKAIKTAREKKQIETLKKMKEDAIAEQKKNYSVIDFKKAVAGQK